MLADKPRQLIKPKDAESLPVSTLNHGTIRFLEQLDITGWSP